MAKVRKCGAVLLFPIREHFGSAQYSTIRVLGMRPAKSSTQPRKAKTWRALKFKWTPSLAF